MQLEEATEGREMMFDILAELGETSRVEEVLGSGRKRDLVEIRSIISAGLRYGLELSYQEIADLMGGRNHSTIINQLMVYKSFARTKGEIHILKCLSVDQRENYYKFIIGF